MRSFSVRGDVLGRCSAVALTLFLAACSDGDGRIGLVDRGDSLASDEAPDTTMDARSDSDIADPADAVLGDIGVPEGEGGETVDGARSDVGGDTAISDGEVDLDDLMDGLDGDTATTPNDAPEADVSSSDDATAQGDTGGEDADSGTLQRACRGNDPQLWQDLSGYGHHGTFFDLDPTVFWAGDGTPDAPYSLELGATPLPRLELPNADVLRLPTGSAEFWLRAESTTFANKMVYSHRAGAEFAGVVLFSQAGQWKGVGTASPTRWMSVFAAPGHTVGLWQHVVLVWEHVGNTTAMRIYVDGVETGASSLAGQILYSAKGRPQIGGLDGGWGSFDGGIALARIWGGALLAAEVRALYNADAEARFGRSPVTGDAVWPAADLLASFDAAPCD